MKFDRVRTEEQRKIRVDQIKDAATKLFDEMNYHEITLALIANETNFTRGNLYKYISSKEEIFLLVLLDEIKNLVKEADSQITTDLSGDIEFFSRKWAEVAYNHQRFLKLISLLTTIIEKNVTLDKLVDFKNGLAIEFSKLLEIIKRAFPELDDRKIIKFINLQTTFSSGLYPVTAPTDIQIRACKESIMDYEFPDFVEDFSEFVMYTLEYLLKLT